MGCGKTVVRTTGRNLLLLACAARMMFPGAHAAEEVKPVALFLHARTEGGTNESLRLRVRRHGRQEPGQGQETDLLHSRDTINEYVRA